MCARAPKISSINCVGRDFGTNRFRLRCCTGLSPALMMNIGGSPALIGSQISQRAVTPLPKNVGPDDSRDTLRMPTKA